MSAIYVIAGAPGVGKSTSGAYYISDNFDILNEDDVILKYKRIGYPDHQQYAMSRVRGIIRNELINNRDLALELNLGYQHQYEYIIDVKRFRKENQLHIILFHTDSLQLCQERVKQRYKNGLHYVSPQIVSEMYNNMIPLLKLHFQHIASLLLLDVRETNDIELVALYNRELATLDLYHSDTIWFKNDLRSFIQNFIINLKK